MREQAVEEKVSVFDLLKKPSFINNHIRSKDALLKFNERLELFRERFQENISLARLVESYLNGIGYIEGIGHTYKPREDAEKGIKMLWKSSMLLKLEKKRNSAA